MWCGVPSVAAIGPFGGRGVPSGGWALTLTHTLDSNLGTAIEVIDGKVANESGKEGRDVLRSAGRLGEGSGTATGRPTRGTAMLRRCHRLCAAADQWGVYASKNSSYAEKVTTTHKKGINSGGNKWYLEKNIENNNSPGEESTGRETVRRAGMVPRRALEKRRDPPTAEKKETGKQAFTSLTSQRPDARTHRLPHRRHAPLARLPLLPRPRSGTEAERPDRHAASSTWRPRRGACDRCGVPQKYCCCCCCHGSSWSTAAQRLERLRTGARATHARCEACCTRCSACTAPDRQALSPTHTLTAHTCSCLLWCTAAARAARGVTDRRGKHATLPMRWGASSHTRARPTAHHTSVHPAQAPPLKCLCACLRCKVMGQGRNGESNGERRPRGEGECPPPEEAKEEPSLREGTRRRRDECHQGERRGGTTLPLCPPPRSAALRRRMLGRSPEGRKKAQPKKKWLCGGRKRRKKSRAGAAGGAQCPSPRTRVDFW